MTHVLSAPALAAQFEPRPLVLPSALWADGATSFNGQLSGRVSMRKVKYARILAERGLSLPATATSWPGGSGVRRVELAGPDIGLSLGEFNEAKLDYLTAGTEHPGCLGFLVELAGPGQHEVFVSDPLESVGELTPEWADGKDRDAVLVARADWAPKGIRYLMSRLLNREPDQLWRYSQDGLSTFVQRRFRKDLTDVGAIDVVLLRGQDVQVNLVVSLDPEGKGKTVLDWYGIPKRTFDLGDGRSILRLYVGRYLRELAPGRKGISLKEMALMFFKQNPEDVLRARNVEKIIFAPSGLDPALLAAGLPRDLPARAREVFTGRGELAANLQVLDQAPWKGRALASLSVLQSPQDPGQPFSQTLEAARLARVAPRRDVPALLAATAERCKSFGASCDIDDLNGLVGQDPLWSLNFESFAAGGEAGSDPANTVHPAFADKLFTSKGRLGFSSAPDGLTVECSGGDLALETGTAFTPEPGREYSLWLEVGRSRHGLAGVEAEAYGEGRSVTVAVKPGFPTVFSGLPRQVDGVRLRFLAGGPEMSVTLRRAVLQSYAKDAPGQNLYSARYLFDEAQVLETVRRGSSDLDLKASGPLFEAQWLMLTVSTAPWTVNDQPPQLELAIGGKRTSLALPASSSRLAVFLPGLTSGHIQKPPSAWPDMSLALSGGAPGARLECGRALLAGQRLATWPEVLGSGPLLEAAGSEHSLAGMDADDAQRMAASAHWLPMGRAGIPVGSGTVQFVKNPWLEVEALLVSNASGPELSSLGKEAEAVPGKPGKTVKWLAGLAGVLGLVAVWFLARRGAFRYGLGLLADWLDRSHGLGGKPLPLRGWLVAIMAIPAAGVVFGPEVFRLGAMLGTMFAVPFWRALRPRLARVSPLLAKTPALHYCTGFLATAVLATVLRLAGAAPVSEFFGLCGLWLFCAALVSHFRIRPNPSRSTP